MRFFCNLHQKNWCNIQKTLNHQAPNYTVKQKSCWKQADEYNVLCNQVLNTTTNMATKWVLGEFPLRTKTKVFYSFYNNLSLHFLKSILFYLIQYEKKPFISKCMYFLHHEGGKGAAREKIIIELLLPALRPTLLGQINRSWLFMYFLNIRIKEIFTNKIWVNSKKMYWPNKLIV